MRLAFALAAAAGAAVAPIAVAPPVPRSPARLSAALDDLVAAYPGRAGQARRPSSCSGTRDRPPRSAIRGRERTHCGDPCHSRTRRCVRLALSAGGRQGAVRRSGARSSGSVVHPAIWRLPGGAGPPRRGALGRRPHRAVRPSAGAAEALAAVARDLEALAQPRRNTFGRSPGPTIAARSPEPATSRCTPMARRSTSIRNGVPTGDGRPDPAPAQTLPDEIVAAFERHGFIWGGKWAHFDSFHFEYRPELIRAARRGN